ncbi:MAG: hypothetical protein ACPG51_19330 [Thiolinea sp.]
MNVIFKRSVLSVAASLLVLSSAFLPWPSTRAANPIGSTEITQLANNVELVAILQQFRVTTHDHPAISGGRS